MVVVVGWVEVEKAVREEVETAVEEEVEKAVRAVMGWAEEGWVAMVREEVASIDTQNRTGEASAPLASDLCRIRRSWRQSGLPSGLRCRQTTQ
jgi:hypothetical protein